MFLDFISNLVVKIPKTTFPVISKKIQKDFNRKGLISEQGNRKKAFYTLQKYYKSMDK